MKGFVYRGAKTREISFPLGGIGTGCIGLAGNGRLIDWEIYNKPNKGGHNGFSFFALRAHREDGFVDSRVLMGDLQPPYSGEGANFGFGPKRENLAGMPHFENTEFIGEFPFAKIRFQDPGFPGRAALTAFNPFIPHNSADSSLPAAFFEIETANTTEKTVKYTAAFTVQNPHASGTTVNRAEKADGYTCVRLESDRLEKTDIGYGDLCLVCGERDVSYQEYWYRGRWFDSLDVFWEDFNVGELKNRAYASPEKSVRDTATIAATFTLAPGESKSVRFILSWSFPNNENYWSPPKSCCRTGECGQKPNTWMNYYATVFKNSLESALYCIKNYDALKQKTLRFKNALYSTTIAHASLEAVCANLSLLKSPTCLRLEDGSLYGFEGCNCNSGCCEGSCTHVWHYAYTFALLFPDLQRSMQDLDFKYNQDENGGMSFRLQLPLERERWSFRPCADGQMGGVMRAYQHWKYTGDTNWLKTHWEAIKKCVKYAWSEKNPDRWDYDRDGVLEGRQHHTLDMELFGPSSWLNGFYLGALKAGAEMAEYLGDTKTARDFGALYEKGRAWTDDNLFNGEYYIQKIELHDKTILEKYNAGSALTGQTTADAYWNEEAGEIKYQIGEGCEIDQVLAQWHANLSGLGDIFCKQNVRKALLSIYRYNFKPSMRNHANPCRVYCLNGEAGLVICEWPEGRHKPVCPVPYAQETMNGFEYQAASHMIWEGYLEKGEECVRAVRERYDGEKRNPWNEFECGSNYARSMASYTLIASYSGFECDMTRGYIGFSPRLPAPFKTFWSTAGAWGTLELKKNTARLAVLSGELKLKELRLPLAGMIKSLRIGRLAPEFTEGNGLIAFKKEEAIGENISLRISF